MGENGHLAFSNPPADFETEEPYRIVTLDETCRQQQLGENWFRNLEEAPWLAIRKVRAVVGEIGWLAPASILRTHPNDVTGPPRAI